MSEKKERRVTMRGRAWIEGSLVGGVHRYAFTTRDDGAPMIIAPCDAELTLVFPSNAGGDDG